MGNQEIQVNAEKTHNASVKAKDNSSKNPYDRNKLDDYLYTNSGDVRNELFTLNSNFSMCAGVTNRLMALTSIFLENTAKIFEQTDEAIAKELKSK